MRLIRAMLAGWFCTTGLHGLGSLAPFMQKSYTMFANEIRTTGLQGLGVVIPFMRRTGCTTGFGLSH